MKKIFDVLNVVKQKLFVKKDKIHSEKYYRRIDFLNKYSLIFHAIIAMAIVFIRVVSNFLLLLCPKKTRRKTSCIVCSTPHAVKRFQWKNEPKVGSYPSGGLVRLCPNRIVFYHNSLKSICAKRPYLLVRERAVLH